MPLDLVYAGTPEFAVPALDALVAAGHAVHAVLTQPDRPAGRGRHLQVSAVKRRALELGLSVLQPPTLREPGIQESLAAIGADALVVAAYGLLLPPAVLAVPRLGCLNVHASLLPRWRGAAPIQRAIEAGDRTTGVAIMQMAEGLDTGPVYATASVEIGPRETALGLSRTLAKAGAALLVTTLARLEHGTVAAVPQSETGVSYARKLDKAEAALDWSLAALELDRKVRAFVPWPAAETRWRGAQLKVHAAAPVAGPDAPPGTVMDAGPDGLDVATGSGRLRLLRVQLAGRSIVGAAEFARSEARHGPLVGTRLDGAS